MTTLYFASWLKGFFEGAGDNLTADDFSVIKEQLKNVDYKHDVKQPCIIAPVRNVRN